MLPVDTSQPLPKKHWFSKQWHKIAAPMRYGNRTVEQGFVHDYASIPRIFWPVLTPNGPYGVAAIFHDKFHDDKLFYEMMIEGGTPKWLATIMYTVVAHPPNDPEDITNPDGNGPTGLND